MSALDLDALEALCDAATPGPWVAAPSPWEGVSAPHGDPRDGGSCEIVDCVRGPSHGDAAFIAAAREALPALITRLRAAEARTAWQPIETAPRGEWVEVWGTLFRCDEPGHHIARLDSWGWGDRAGIMIEPTHYRRLGPAHLPAAPGAP